MKNNREFTVTKGETELKLAVRKPRLDELREAQKIQTKAFHDAIESGAVLRVKLDEILKAQGLWDQSKDVEIKTLQKEIIDMEMTLRRGGLKVSVGKDLAFKIIEKRDRIKEIFAVKLMYDGKTAEAIADDAKTDFLLSVCLVYNDTGKPYFKNLEDYLNNQNDTVAIEGYRNFIMLMNDHDETDVENNFIEYKFLKRFKMVDDKLRLINKEGQLVDRHGNLIDENGRYIKIDAEGNKSFVDINGNPVDEKGEYCVQEEPFLDDDGNVIVE